MEINDRMAVMGSVRREKAFYKILKFLFTISCYSSRHMKVYL